MAGEKAVGALVVKRSYLILLLCCSVSLRAQLNFPPGEELEYEVYYNFIKAGKAVLKIVDTLRVDSLLLYHARSTTFTLPLFDPVYKVRDQMESHFHVKTMFSYYFSKDIHEGFYKKRYSVRFQYSDSLAISGKKRIKIPGGMFDPVSLLFYLRADSLYIDKELDLPIFDNNKVRHYRAKVTGKEKIKTPAGEYSCFVIEPAGEKRVLKYGGSLTVWLAENLNSAPIMVKSKATIGSMKMRLVNYTPGRF